MLASGTTKAADAATRILLLGDSTVAEFPSSRPMRGWGQFLAPQLENVEIINLAVSGASSKSFLTCPSWQKAKVTDADIWLIQFGHNDDPSKGDRATRADGDYKENLRQMIDLARDRTARPILVTMPYRRIFTSDHTLDERQKPYVEAMRSVAAETDTPLIDLYDESGKLFLSQGKEGSARLTVTGDNTHFSEDGAIALAHLVALRLKEIQPSLTLAEDKKLAPAP